MTPVVIPPERLAGNRERILRILHPTIGHRFLPSAWIEHHLAKPCEHANFIRTLRDLRRKPNQYIYWPEQQEYSLNAAYKDGVHGLTDRGAKAVGLPLPRFSTHEYAHELGVSVVECSLKFGARDLGIPFQMAEPQSFRFGDVEYVPDGHPMLIGDIFIPGIEFERRKYKENPGDTSEKILKVIRFMKERIYEREGFAKALVLFVATTERRTENLMSYVAEMLGTCSFILFKTTRDWAREPNFPKPNGDMLTEPWLRVGCPPLTIATQARKEGADVQQKS